MKSSYWAIANILIPRSGDFLRGIVFGFPSHVTGPLQNDHKHHYCLYDFNTTRLLAECCVVFAYVQRIQSRHGTTLAPKGCVGGIVWGMVEDYLL